MITWNLLHPHSNDKTNAPQPRKFIYPTKIQPKSSVFSGTFQKSFFPAPLSQSSIFQKSKKSSTTLSGWPYQKLAGPQSKFHGPTSWFSKNRVYPNSIVTFQFSNIPPFSTEPGLREEENWWPTFHFPTSCSSLAINAFITAEGSLSTSNQENGALGKRIPGIRRFKRLGKRRKNDGFSGGNPEQMSFGFYTFIFYLDILPPFRGPFREASATCMFASARASSKQQLPRASAE